jgi:hypothetical protein
MEKIDLGCLFLERSTLFRQVLQPRNTTNTQLNRGCYLSRGLGSNGVTAGGLQTNEKIGSEAQKAVEARVPETISTRRL